MTCAFCTHGGNWIQISYMQRQHVTGLSGITSLPLNIRHNSLWSIPQYFPLNILCCCVATDTPASPVSRPCRGPSWPFVVVGFRREREPKLSRLFASAAGEWATRKPPTSEPLHRRFPLRDQVRWALPPGDLQHSRYSTAPLPKLWPTRSAFNRGHLKPAELRTLQNVRNTKSCGKVLVSTWLRPWSLDHWLDFPSVPETRLPTMACQD